MKLAFLVVLPSCEPSELVPVRWFMNDWKFTSSTLPASSALPLLPVFCGSEWCVLELSELVGVPPALAKIDSEFSFLGFSGELLLKRAEEAVPPFGAIAADIICII